MDIATKDVGLKHLQHGRFEEALEALSAYYAAVPHDYEAGTAIAMACFKLGRRDESSERFAVLLQNHPKSSSVRYHLGLALEEAGKVDAARKAYEAALELKPGFAAAKRRLEKLTPLALPATLPAPDPAPETAELLSSEVAEAETLPEPDDEPVYELPEPDSAPPPPVRSTVAMTRPPADPAPLAPAKPPTVEVELLPDIEEVDLATTPAPEPPAPQAGILVEEEVPLATLVEDREEIPVAVLVDSGKNAPRLPPRR